MAISSQTKTKPTVIVELPMFEGQAKSRLDKVMLRALYLLLADNPLEGKPVPGYPGLLQLQFAGHQVLYVIGEALSKIYLVGFVDPADPLPPASSIDGRAIRKVLAGLVGGGIVLVIREGIRELWKFLRELL